MYVPVGKASGRQGSVTSVFYFLFFIFNEAMDENICIDSEGRRLEGSLRREKRMRGGEGEGKGAPQ